MALQLSLAPSSRLFAGGHGEAAIPVPIPNTEVKRLIAEGSAGLARARVGRRRLFHFHHAGISGSPRFFFAFDIPPRFCDNLVMQISIRSFLTLLSFMLPLALAAAQTVKEPSPQSFRLPLADPFILLDKGVYYAYGTQSPHGITVARSKDLQYWDLHV